MAIVARHKKLAFVGVLTGSQSGSTAPVYHRIHKFTSFTHNKNPKEYARQYVDEPFEETDVVGYAPSYDYGFDKYTGDPVQGEIIKITDGEKLGDDAVLSIIVVDTEGDGTHVAYKRDYSVIPGAEGDNINIYTYSGTMKARGAAVKGTAATSDDWETITFTEDT